MVAIPFVCRQNRLAAQIAQCALWDVAATSLLAPHFRLTIVAPSMPGTYFNPAYNPDLPRLLTGTRSPSPSTSWRTVLHTFFLNVVSEDN